MVFVCSDVVTQSYACAYDDNNDEFAALITWLHADTNHTVNIGDRFMLLSAPAAIAQYTRHIMRQPDLLQSLPVKVAAILITLVQIDPATRTYVMLQSPSPFLMHATNAVRPRY